MADPLAIGVLLVGALALWVWPRVPRTAALLVMALLVAVSGIKLTTRASAATAYTRAASTQASARRRDRGGGVGIVDVPGCSSTDCRTGAIRAWRADGWTGDAQLRFEQEPTLDAPFARRSLDEFATARNFLPAHPYAFATWRDNGNGGVVFWSDARFCWTAAERADAQDDVPHQDVRPARGPRALRVVVRRLLRRAGPPDRSARVARRPPSATIARIVGDRRKDGGRRREDGGRKED